MYLKKWLKETELSRFWKMGIQVYSIWLYEANPKNRSDPHNTITGFGIEIWKASWFPRILFLGQPSKKYQALPNPQNYIKNSNEKREKKKEWFRDLINPKEWFESRERERKKIFWGWAKHFRLECGLLLDLNRRSNYKGWVGSFEMGFHGMRMWGRRWKFLVVVKVPAAVIKRKSCDLWIILERERKEELTEKIGISVNFVSLI